MHHIHYMRPLLLFITLLFPASAMFAQTEAPDTVPPFVFRALGDSATVVSSESLKGSVYIVDFWATWCPPCVEELPALTEAFEAFRKKGFTIVSLSFDEKPDRVASFRQHRFSMPWIHGHVAEGFADVLSMQFNVQNIPYIILVDRGGHIVASGDELRGEALQQTLQRHLN